MTFISYCKNIRISAGWQYVQYNNAKPVNMFGGVLLCLIIACCGQFKTGSPADGVDIGISAGTMAAVTGRGVSNRRFPWIDYQAADSVTLLAPGMAGTPAHRAGFSI
jgi:hypothetical protein